MQSALPLVVCLARAPPQSADLRAEPALVLTPGESAAMAVGKPVTIAGWGQQVQK